MPASVGFQCPECVREGNRGVRTARTTFGGAVAAGRTGVVTYVIIGICVVLEVLRQVPAADLTARFALIGGPLSDSLLGRIGVADGEYYRLVTAAFLHGSLVHLAVNMFSLYLLGPSLEHLLGRGRYLALYLVSAVGGTAASYLLNPPVGISVGASGAIFGLFGAMVVVSRRLNLDLRPVLAIIAVNAVIGFLHPRIDWEAHLGGLITGGLVAVALVYAPRERRQLVQFAGIAAVLLVVVAVVLVRTAQLRG